MHILHFADLHIDADSSGPMDPATRINGRVMDYLDTFDAMIDYAYEVNADLVLFAGDAFHNHHPNPTYFREFAARIMRLSEQCPVVLLVGNHDIPGSAERATAIDVFQTLKVNNIIIGNTNQLHKIDTKNGIVQVATVPYPIRNAIITGMDAKKTKEQKNKIVSDVLSIVISRLESELEEDYPAILLGHFSVNNAKYSIEREMMIGDDAEVSIKAFSNIWDYVALGHIHYHQCLSEEPIIIYAGSMERVDFGEEFQSKGFVDIEITNEDIAWEFIEVDARPFVTINIDVRGSVQPAADVLKEIKVQEDIEDAVVRVLIESDDPLALPIGRIHKLLQNKGAYYVKNIGVKVNNKTRRKFDVDDGVDIMKMGHQDLLEIYFKDKGVKKTERSELMDLANEVIEEATNGN